MSDQPCPWPPANIQSGDTYHFYIPSFCYSPTEWNGTLYLSQGIVAPTAITATSGGPNQFLIEITAAQSATFKWGYAQTQFRVAKATDANHKHSIYESPLFILPDLSQTQTLSIAQTMAAAAQEAILSIATGGNQSVSFNGQSFTKQNISSLQSIYAFWKAQVIQEQNALNAARGYDTTGVIRSRFLQTDGYLVGGARYPFPINNIPPYTA